MSQIIKIVTIIWYKILSVFYHIMGWDNNLKQYFNKNIRVHMRRGIRAGLDPELVGDLALKSLEYNNHGNVLSNWINYHIVEHKKGKSL